MSELRDFALPDVGEGLTEAEILRWLVRPGDTVAVNQMIVEIETAKAAVELPSPFAGTVSSLHVEVGQVVPVGAPIISIQTQAAPQSAERQAVLVGYGVRSEGTVARRSRRRVPEGEPAAAPAGHGDGRGPVRAKPPVRRLARDLGVDLAAVPATGPQGEVTRADLLAFAGPASSGPAAARAANDAPPPAGAAERRPVRSVQRAMAAAMVKSAFDAPHVTEWVDVDMSRALAVLGRLKEQPGAAEVRMSPMVLVAAGLVRAARRFPLVNSTWEDGTDGAHILVHGAVHLGIAADTPRGLLVPVVRDADAMDLVGLAAAVRDLIDAARAGRSSPGDLTGGTITLTNIGVFGVDGGTPILSPGQSAILAMGRILERAWVVDGQVVPRPVMQLTLSFDHRVVDGALGSRVLRSVADFLADPALELLLDRTGPS